MAVSSNQVAMNSSTATLIVPAVNANTIYTGHGTQPRSVNLLNLDATNDIYIGPAGVTSGTGYKLIHGSTVLSAVNLLVGQSEAIYGISSGGTPTALYIESGS